MIMDPWIYHHVVSNMLTDRWIYYHVASKLLIDRYLSGRPETDYLERSGEAQPPGTTHCIVLCTLEKEKASYAITCGDSRLLIFVCYV